MDQVISKQFFPRHHLTGSLFNLVKIWDLEADKCREEFIPAPDIPVRSLSIVSYLRLPSSCVVILFRNTNRATTFPHWQWAPTKDAYLFTPSMMSRFGTPRTLTLSSFATKVS